MGTKQLRQRRKRLRKSNTTVRSTAGRDDAVRGDASMDAFFQSREFHDLHSVISQMQAEGKPISDIALIIAGMSTIGYPREQTVAMLNKIMDYDVEQFPASDQPVDDVADDDSATQNSPGDSPFLELTTAQLLDEQPPREWLLPGVLARHEPAAIVGPCKSMKSSLAVDLCSALASGGQFLGQIAASRAFRVGFVSGASERHALTDLARRWSDAAHVEQLPNLVWALTLASLADAANLGHLCDWITRHRLEVVLIDPRDLTAPRGVAKSQQLRALVRCCLDAGATPILCCQTSRSIQRRGLDPADMASAGCLDIARQWLLVNRRREYEPGSGQHHLWLTIGGNGDLGRRWGVDIDEGCHDDPASRKWSVTLHDVASLQEEAPTLEARSLEQRMRLKIRVAIASLDPEKATKSKIREQSGISGAKFAPVWERMIVAGEIVAADFPNASTSDKIPRYQLAPREKKCPVQSGPPEWNRRHALTASSPEEHVFNAVE